MFEKFEETFPSWFIVLFPTISALIIIVDKVVNLGFYREFNKGEYVAIVMITSALADIAAMVFIGALLNLCDEYGRKGRDKNV